MVKQWLCCSRVAVLCFGSMVQINWQEEAREARRLWEEAHKHIPAEVLQHALSSADVEQPSDSSLALVPEQTGAYTTLLSTCVFCCTSCTQICYAPYSISLPSDCLCHALVLVIMFCHVELSNDECNFCCRAHTSSRFQCDHSYIHVIQAAAEPHKYTTFWYTWPANLCGVMGKSNLCKSD